MSNYGGAIERVMTLLGELPGIGARTAERLAFHLLKADEADALALADAIRDLKTAIHPCEICYNPTEGERCAICADDRRDRATICVVEQPKDLLNIESTGVYTGVYHVLMGAIAPLDDVEPEDLTLDALFARVDAGGISEVILATNPTVAGDATSLYVREHLAGRDVKITRLARGLPAGGQIEYANKTVLSDALNDRRET